MASLPSSVTGCGVSGPGLGLGREGLEDESLALLFGPLSSVIDGCVRGPGLGLRREGPLGRSLPLLPGLRSCEAFLWKKRVGFCCPDTTGDGECLSPRMEPGGDGVPLTGLVLNPSIFFVACALSSACARSLSSSSAFAFAFALVCSSSSVTRLVMALAMLSGSSPSRDSLSLTGDMSSNWPRGLLDGPEMPGADSLSTLTSNGLRNGFSPSCRVECALPGRGPMMLPEEAPPKGSLGPPTRLEEDPLPAPMPSFRFASEACGFRGGLDMGPGPALTLVEDPMRLDPRPLNSVLLWFHASSFMEDV